MAIYELEDRIYFDGGLPADIAEAQEDTSEQNLENSEQTENNSDAGTDNSANVSIAPDSPSSEDSGDNEETGSDDGSDEVSSDSESNEPALSSLGEGGSTVPDDITALLDSITDTTITDDFLDNQNFLIISADHENFEEIADSLNDNTTLIVYDSDNTYDSIIWQLKVELGDSKAVNIGILNSEKLIENSEKCNDFLNDLKELQYFDGEINILDLRLETTDQRLANGEPVRSSLGEGGSIMSNRSILSRDIQGECSIIENADSDGLSDYFYSDSSLLSTISHHLSSEASAQGESSTNNEQLTSEIYFIDYNVEDIDTLLDEIPEYATVIKLEEGEGIDTITEIINSYSDIDAVHILSQANYAQILLGDDVITADNIDDYSDAFSSWSDNLSADADILFYGCDIAKEASGQSVINQIAEWTGADIAASTDITGSLTTEGTENTEGFSISLSSNIQNSTSNIIPDWDLEYTTGSIEATVLAAIDYSHHLETYTVTETTDDGTGTVAGTFSWAIAQSNFTTTVDTINFNLGEGSVITVAGAGLTISDDLTINGNGVTVSFEDGNAALKIDDGVDSSMINVTIKDLTVEAYGNTSSDADEAEVNMLRNSENLTIINTSIDDIGYVYAHIPGNVENPKVILISSILDDVDDLVAAVNNDVIAIEYNPETTDLNELISMVSTALNGRKAASVAFATHDYGKNTFYLTDSQAVNLGSTLSNTDQQEFWQSMALNIEAGGRIDLLACNLASEINGELLLASLESVAGINFAASTDATGNPDTGGNWILETDNINIKNEYFNAEKILNYTELMWSNIKTYTVDYDSPTANIRFGYSLSIDGDYAVVGAYYENSSTGAAYVFYNDSGTWEQQTKLTADDGAANNFFGNSVSINGNYIVIGAYGAMTTNGSAYVFYNDSGTWTQQAKLTEDALDYFGYSVSIDGDTIFIGAPYADSFHGAAYVYERSDTNWAQTKVLSYEGGSETPQFGWSVSISGDNIVVGAPTDESDGIVRFYNRNTGGINNWGLVFEDSMHDGASPQFSASISIDGNYAVVGAYKADIDGITDKGAAYIYEYSDNTWNYVKTITADVDQRTYFGYSVSINNNTIAAGAYCEYYYSKSAVGSVYIFDKDQGGTDNWGQTDKLVLESARAGIQFGYCVAVSSNTVLSGAPNYFASAKGAGIIYENIEGSWEQTTVLHSPYTGYATDSSEVAIDGKYAIAGESFTGSVYIFEYLNGTWENIQVIQASNGQLDNRFGCSVSIDGDYIVIGAYDAGVDENITQGAAYVFQNIDGSWTQVEKLTADDGNTDTEFGSSVSIDGDYIVVGDYDASVNGFDHAGAAYIYNNNVGTWEFVKRLTADTPAENDYFSIYVDVCSNNIIATTSSLMVDPAYYPTYVFNKDQGGQDNWGKVTTLVYSAPAAGVWFDSYSVSLDENFLAVGNMGSDEVYIYKTSDWSLIQTLTGSDTQSGDKFGRRVSLDGNVLAVQALIDKSYYTFEYIGETWSQDEKITITGTSIFMSGMAISNNMLAGFNKVDLIHKMYFYEDDWAYRTVADGDWADTGIWEYTMNGGANWQDVLHAPTYYNSTSILVRNDVGVNSDLEIDETNVDTGALLTVSEGAQLSVLNDGTIGNDLTVNGTGTVDINGTIDATGTEIVYTGTGNLYITGTAVSLGTFTAGSSTVTYDGGNQTIIAVDYNTLSFADSTTGSTKTFTADTYKINNQIELTETITLTGDSSSTTTVQVTKPYNWNGITGDVDATNSRVFYINTTAGEIINIQNMEIKGGNIGLDYGGTIYVYGGTLNISNVLVSGSKADYGGNIYITSDGNQNTNVIIRNSTVEYGYAGNDGGGIYNYAIAGGYSYLTTERTTVNNNTSAGDGGGIYNYISIMTTGHAVFSSVNSTIYDNIAAGGYGGGIYSWGGTTVLTDTTVTGNKAATQGAGFYNTNANATAVFTNSIIAYNYLTDNSTYSDLNHSDSDTVYGNYNIIGGWGDAELTGTGNINYTYTSGLGDPLFESYTEITADQIYSPVLADNGGYTYTVALAENSIAAGQGVRTGSYDNPGTTKYVFYDGINWVKVEDGETIVDSGLVTEISVDQREENRNSGYPTIGSYVNVIYEYQTKADGDWESYTVWQRRAAGSSDIWVDLVDGNAVPDYTADSISVKNAITVNSDITIDQTTVTAAGSLLVDISGGTGTLTLRNDTDSIDLLLEGGITVSAASTLLIAGGAVADFNSSTNITGTLSFVDGVSNNGIVNISTASAVITNLTAGSGTVNYDGTSQAVAAGNYYNLTVSNSGTKTVTYGNTTISGAGTISDSAKVQITVNATAENKIYDGTDEAQANLSLNNIFTGYTVSIAAGYTAVFDNANVRTDKDVVISGITLEGADSEKFVLDSDSLTSTADITKASLTITAENQTKEYGQTFTFGGTEFTAYGIISGTGDAVSSASLSSSGASAVAAAGEYVISISNATGSGLANYSINYISGTLTVTPSSSSSDESGRPDINNGEMINDGTQTQTYTSWRTAIDDGPSNSIDSREGFEPNETEGVGLVMDSLITLDISAESVANGEYTMENLYSSPGFFNDGEYEVNFNSDGLGLSSNSNQEFASEYRGMVDLSFDIESDNSHINYDAIAAYNDRHPLFKTELDLLMEKI